MNTPLETEVARQLLWVLEDHPIDVKLTAMAEALARVIAAQDCEADDALVIIERFAREWLRTGGLLIRIVREHDPGANLRADQQGDYRHGDDPDPAA